MFCVISTACQAAAICFKTVTRCCVHWQMHRLTQLAGERAGELMQTLKAALQRHEASMVSMRVRRHASAPQQPLGALPHSVTLLPPADVTGE